MEIKTQYQHLVAEIERAGAEARAYFTDDNTENEQKTDGSVVTAVDHAVEEMLVSYIRTHFPDDSIIGEEGDDHAGTSSFVWHIDPIDGTENFLRKIPFCAISVARLGATTEGSFAIVHNPITQQTFAALMYGDVYENTRIHRIHDQSLGSRAVISVCKGKESWMSSATYNLQKALGLQFGKGASLGCCALELAYVAANRFDGVLTFGLNSYDYAAGLFLIAAGGGRISVWQDGEWQPWTDSMHDLCSTHGRMIFASHPGIHDQALALIGDPRTWSDT